MLVGATTDELGASQLFELAEGLLLAGAVYVVCWGSGASRLEDIFDEAAVHTIEQSEPIVMTTSHEGEALVDVLEFAASAAVPAAENSSQCKTTLIIFAGNSQWYSEAKSGLKKLVTASVA